MIPDEAVEAALAAIYPGKRVTGLARNVWLGNLKTILEAAAPHLMAAAWADGHESGFWNGRESAGSGEMAAVGIEHEKIANPYRKPTNV